MLCPSGSIKCGGGFSEIIVAKNQPPNKLKKLNSVENLLNDNSLICQ
jgi:hypothetical protein